MVEQVVIVIGRLELRTILNSFLKLIAAVFCTVGCQVRVTYPLFAFLTQSFLFSVTLSFFFVQLILLSKLKEIMNKESDPNMNL